MTRTARTTRERIRRLVSSRGIGQPSMNYLLVSYVKCLKWSESFSVFHFGFNSLMKSISKIRQSNLYLHFFNTEKKCTLSPMRKNISVIYSCFIWLSFLFGVERKKTNKQNKNKIKKKQNTDRQHWNPHRAQIYRSPTLCQRPLWTNSPEGCRRPG